jgi:hypothetical protein
VNFPILPKKGEKMQKSGFYVSKRQDEVGFKVFFPNGYGISVIFGGDSASDSVFVRKNELDVEYFCENAEIAVINSDGDMVPFTDNKKVKEFSNPENLLQIFSWTMNK